MSVEWWVADALEKVFPETGRPVNANTVIELWCARNETEDAQVAVVIPPEQRVNKAAFSFRHLNGPRQHTLPCECCDAWWQWYTYVHANPRRNTDPATYLRAAPAFFPDAFLEDKEIGLRGGVTQPLWVSIHVPEDAAPGRYEGELRVSLDFRHKKGTTRIRVPMIVNVWPFTLPAKPSLHHTEWVCPSVIADHYNVEMWSEPHWTWIERIARDMGRHRQDMILTDFFSLVDTSERRDGQLDFAFSRLDRWIDIFQSAGVDWIEGRHLAHRTGDWQSPFALSGWKSAGWSRRKPVARQSRDARLRGRNLLKEVRNSVACNPACHTHDNDQLQGVRRSIGDTVAELITEK